MSKRLDEQVESELKKLAEGSIAIQRTLEQIGKGVEKTRKMMEAQEPDEALQDLRELDNFYKDLLGRLHLATSELEIHANILIAYQNSRLTKEVAKQSRRLTWATIVLTVATAILALPLIIQYVSWFLK